MIILLTGDNFYEIDQELGRIVAGFDGEPERIDTENLEPRQLTDIFSGVSLFSAERLVILRHASEHSALWEALGERADTETDTTLVLVEPKVDKRTKTYKALSKHADVRVYAAWGERDSGKAEQWLQAEAKARGVVLAPAAAREIVRRRGVEQYQLRNTLEQLAVLGDITPEVVERHIEATPHENVFMLLEAAVRGNARRVRDMIAVLRHDNEPYMTMGLLASQAFALGGLVLGSEPQKQMAQDLGVNPYVLNNLSRTAGVLDRDRLRRLVDALAVVDVGLKSSAVDPWVQIEIALTTK